MNVVFEPYQARAVAWLRTKRRGAVHAPAGSGKTIIAAGTLRSVIDAKQRPRLVRAGWVGNTEEHCDQAWKALCVVFDICTKQQTEGDVWRNGKAAFVAAVLTLVDVRVACAAAATDWSDRDVLIVDECFPAGTLVDGRPIETVKVGDSVKSFNHETMRTESGLVTKLYKTAAKSLVTIHLSNGQAVRCTAGHPVFTQRGYVEAILLTSNDVMLSITKHEHIGVPWMRKTNATGWALFSIPLAGVRRVPVVSEGIKTKNGAGSLQKLRSQSEVHGALSKPQEPFGSGRSKRVLQSGMRLGMGGQEIVSNDGKDKPDVCLETHEVEKPNESCRRALVGVNQAESDGMEAASARREREGANGSRITCCERAWMADECNCENGADSRGGLSASLQGGCGEPEFENSNRSGRCEPSRKAGFGQEKDHIAEIVRVASVEVHQQTSCGTFGGLCQDGFTYNLEVEGNHNYFANGFLVHNCHHAPAEGWAAQIASCGGTVWGFTATPPEEEDERLPAYTAIFGGECFEISREEVGSRLVQASVIMLSATDYGLKDVIDSEIETAMAYRRRYWHTAEIAMCRRILADKSASDERKTAAVVMMEKLENQLWGQVAWQCCVKFGIVGNKLRTRAAVAKAVEHRRDSVIVLVNHVDHAEFVAGEIPGAVACYSKMGKKKRRDALEGFSGGRVPCIVATSLADEGLDVPRANVLVLVSAGRSNARTEQRTGRVLRSFAGKSSGIIYDFNDLWHPLAAKHSRVRANLYSKLGYSVR